MLQARLSQWTVTMCVAGIGLAAVLLVPNEGYTDSGGGTWFRHWEQKKDFASRTFRLLLQDRKDCGSVTERHERVLNLDDTAVISGSRESALLADNEPMGTTGSEMSVDLSELP